MISRILLALIFLLSVATASAQSLEGRALANLEAYTRLLGYIYYFHPSDAVAETEWQAWSALAAKNIDRVEEADTPEELARVLTDIVEPYAPTVQIYPTGTEPVSVASEGATHVVFWVHNPTEDLTDTQYAGRLSSRGERVRVPLENGSVPSYLDEDLVRNALEPLDAEAADLQLAIPEPGEPYIAQLPGGVIVAIPLALYADDEGTLPHTKTPTPLTLPEGSPGSNRAVRLATVMRAWNVLQHFFPYWNVIDTDWNNALRVALQDAATDDSGKAFLITLQHLTNRLRDGHTRTYRPTVSDYETHTAPFTVGRIEGELIVTTVAEDNPTEVQPGDKLLEIEGVPAEEALKGMLERVSGVGQAGRYLALRRLLGNEGDSPITVTLEPYGGGVPYTVQAPMVERRDDGHLREYRPPAVAQLAPGIVYVDLTRIYGDEYTYEEAQGIEVLMAHLQSAEGIVFDMRGYPNAFAARLLNYLSSEPLSTKTIFAPVVTRPDHSATQFVNVSDVWSDPVPADEQLTDNIAFIINGNGTVSYAETIMGIIAGYDIGERVGKPTAGANGEFIQLQLPNLYYTSWTGHKVTKFDGSPLFTVGVTPTIPAERTIEGVAAKRDELLEKAYEVVSGEPASEIAIRNLDQLDRGLEPPEVEINLELEPFTNQKQGLRTLRPKDWQQVAPGVYARQANGSDSAKLLIRSEVSSRKVALASLFADTALTAENLQASREITRNGLTWRLHRFEVHQGNVRLDGVLGISNMQGTTYLVLVQSNPDSYLKLYRELFLPVIDAFMVTSPQERSEP